MKKRKKDKQVCIIGLGQFGFEAALALARECEVLAIDQDIERVNKISERVHRAVALDVRDFDNLASVVNADFDDAVVAMSENLEASILCTLHLVKIGCRRIHAKASSDDHAAILRAVGATEIIFPERETADRMAARLANPNLLDFIPLAGDYRVMDVAPPPFFSGRSLLDLNLRKRFGVFVIAVKELVPAQFVFLPGPDFVVKPSDVLVVIGVESDLQAMLEAREPDPTER